MRRSTDTSRAVCTLTILFLLAAGAAEESAKYRFHQAELRNRIRLQFSARGDVALTELPNELVEIAVANY